MALPVNGSTHLIPAYYSFIDPEGMTGWLGLVGWPVVDALPTSVVTHQRQVEHRTGKVCQSETEVLPLCHATKGHRSFFSTCWISHSRSSRIRLYVLLMPSNESHCLLASKKHNPFSLKRPQDNFTGWYHLYYHYHNNCFKSAKK